MKKITIIIALLILTKLPSWSQFVDVRIKIPARSEVKTMGAAWGEEGESFLKWTGISVQENEEISVYLTYERLIPGARRISAGYLNTGLFDIGEMVRFRGDTATFRIRNGGKMIGNIADNPAYLTAWVGISSKQVKAMEIVYN